MAFGVSVVKCCHASVQAGSMSDCSRIHLKKVVSVCGVLGYMHVCITNIPEKRAAVVQQGCLKQDTIFFSSLLNS